MRRTLIALIVVLGGCSLDKGDVSEGPHCEDTETIVPVDEVTALGFSAQAMLDLSVGSYTEVFEWARDASTTALSMEVGAPGEARFVLSEAVYPEGDVTNAIGVVCDDRVEVDVQIDFETADGAFGEVWQLTLSAVSVDTMSFFHELDPDGLVGDYDMADDITETYDQRSLYVSGTFDLEGASGDVTGQISGEEPCEDGDACTAWAAEVRVGTWGVSGGG